MTTVTLAQAQNAGQIAAKIIALTAIQTSLQTALSAGSSINSISFVDSTGQATAQVSGFTMSATDTGTLLNVALTAIANDLAALNTGLANL